MWRSQRPAWLAFINSHKGNKGSKTFHFNSVRHASRTSHKSAIFFLYVKDTFIISCMQDVTVIHVFLVSYFYLIYILAYPTKKKVIVMPVHHIANQMKIYSYDITSSVIMWTSSFHSLPTPHSLSQFRKCGVLFHDLEDLQMFASSQITMCLPKDWETSFSHC